MRPPAQQRSERNAEIRHHRPPVVQQDVLRLDVAVDHSVPMCVVQRVRDLARDPYRLVHTQLRLPVQLLPQRLALDEGHDVVQEPVRRSRIEQRQDVRMLQRRRGLDLLDEPLGA